MIQKYLPKAVANGDYLYARDKMAYGQYLAGIAFNNASLGYVHAMAHQLGGFYNLPHGVCNASCCRTSANSTSSATSTASATSLVRWAK